MKTNPLNYSVDSRILWEAKGKDALRFLQGMCTADLRRALDGALARHAIAGSCSGYFLNLKGKVLSPATFAIFSEDKIFFSLPSASSDTCLEALNRLLVADDVELKTLPNLQCFQVVTTGDLHPKAKSLEIPHRVPGALDRCFVVERLNDSFRLPRAVLSPEHEEWWGPAAPSGHELSNEEYLELRINRGVAEWGRDFGAESFLLEFPTHDTISYHKGCYLGQEVVARTAYRGHVTRAFCCFQSPSPVLEDFVFDATDTQKPIGKITSAYRAKGLGLVRVTALENKSKLVQKTSTGDLHPIEISKALIPYEK